MIRYGEISIGTTGIERKKPIQVAAVGPIDFSERLIGAGQMFDLAPLTCRLPESALHAIVITNDQLRGLAEHMDEIFPSRTAAMNRFSALGLSCDQAAVVGVRVIKNVRSGKIGERLYDVNRDHPEQYERAAV